MKCPICESTNIVGKHYVYTCGSCLLEWKTINPLKKLYQSILNGAYNLYGSFDVITIIISEKVFQVLVIVDGEPAEETVVREPLGATWSVEEFENKLKNTVNNYHTKQLMNRL